MQRIALILIALFARTGTSWAQSSGLEAYLEVARSMSLNDAARSVALDSLTSISLRALNNFPFQGGYPRRQRAAGRESRRQLCPGKPQCPLG